MAYYDIVKFIRTRIQFRKTGKEMPGKPSRYEDLCSKAVSLSATFDEIFDVWVHKHFYTVYFDNLQPFAVTCIILSVIRLQNY